MSRLRRTICVERLESRALLAASLGIPALVVQSTGSEPQVVASIEIENAAGLRAATVEIRYDQSVLQPDLKSVRAGSLWDGKGLAIANVNDQEGVLTAFVFATQDLQLSTGTLLDIDFAFLGAATPDAAAHLQLDDLRLNEGEIPVEGMSSQPAPDHSNTPLAQRRPPSGELPAEAEPRPVQAAPPSKPVAPNVDQPPTPLQPRPADAAPAPPRAPVASQSDAAPQQAKPPASRPVRAEPPARTPAADGAAATADATAGNPPGAELFCTPWPSRPALAPAADASTPAAERTIPSGLLIAAARLSPLGPAAPAEADGSEPAAMDAVVPAAPPPIVPRVVPSESRSHDIPELLHPGPAADIAWRRDHRDSQTLPATRPVASPSEAAEKRADAFFRGIAVGFEELGND